MTECTILLSNLGYARGISGTLSHHLLYAHRHIYCPPAVQQKTLQQLSAIIAQEDPDLCCFVEVDNGSFTSGGFNQLQALVNEKYAHFHIENKYAKGSNLRSFFMTSGKSNGFIAKHPWPHEILSFSVGMKRLIYKIRLAERLTLFFAHFSLNRAMRAQQLLDIKMMMQAEEGEVILLGDFNILTGLDELKTLLRDPDLLLLNREDEPTFMFHKRRLLLDLCICTPSLQPRAALKVVPQPYSDHAALVLKVRS